MDKLFEELDYRRTDRGELILRRRKVPMLNNTVVYEVILNGEFLMSSLFYAAEEALAHLAIDALKVDGAPLDILVGGLGLGYTAAAALEHPEVASLQVVDIFPELIDWHRQGLVPLGKPLTQDPRCQIIAADFFAGIAGNGFIAARPERRYNAILLDIDHTPEHWLHPDHADFYTQTGLQQVRRHLTPGGIFAMWADGRPSAEFISRLQSVFETARGETITFANPITGGESAGTVYLASARSNGSSAPVCNH